MTEILLKECWGMRPHPEDVKKRVETPRMVNTYLGKICVNSAFFTPERIAELRADKTDKQGWHKYREKLREHQIEIESA